LKQSISLSVGGTVCSRHITVCTFTYT